MVESTNYKASECRKASHAGDWYSSKASVLNSQLDGYLKKAKADTKLTEGKILTAIIGPHAGLEYSGPTSAWAYINIEPTKYKRVILLGPSHYLYLDTCALSQM